MKILIDMNLSPEWVAAFQEHKIESVHWSTIGKANAKDSEIMDYARNHGYVVFTHDLDFGTLLALTQATSPSVIQVRSQNILPGSLAETLVRVLLQNETALENGALIVVDQSRERVRVLPLRRPTG